MYTDKIEGKIDYLKTMLEHLKHLATLSTALIVLIPTLIEKVFPDTGTKWLVILSLCVFAFTVLSSVFSYVYTMDAMQYQNDRKEHFLHSTPNGATLGYTIISTWVSFCVGVVLFVIYGAVSI